MAAEKVIPSGLGTRVPAKGKTGHWRIYGVPDGLASGVVYDLVQDRQGYIWMGTTNGVSRYDGETFTHFSREDGLAHDLVYSVLEDREGNLWFGTRGGVSRYDGEIFTTLTVEDGLTSNSVWTMLEDREGTLWFGTGMFLEDVGNGVSRYDGETFTSFTVSDGLPHGFIASIAQDREGNLWFGTHVGVSRFDGEVFTNFTARDGLLDDFIASILEDRDGNLWFAGGGSCICRYDGSSFEKFTVREGFSVETVVAAMEDNEGNLWFGGGGVVWYDGNSFNPFSSHEALSSMALKIYEDREGNIWVGTEGGGVGKFETESFLTFTQNGGLPDNQVYSIHEDGKRGLWFSTFKGVCRYDGEHFTILTSQDGMEDDFVWTVIEDREENLWFGHGYEKGVSRYDGEAIQSFTKEDGLGGDIKAICQDSSGHFWFGTMQSGVNFYDGDSFSSFTTREGLVNDSVHAIYQGADGVLWFGTVGGVSCYAGGSFSHFPLPVDEGLNWVRSIMPDSRGNLWFSTMGGGVVCFDGEVLRNFTTKDGLGTNTVWSIAEDRKGRMWFGTWGGGVSIYDGRTFQTLQEEDGLPSNMVMFLLEDSDGHMWCATNKGVARFSPPEPHPPGVQVDAVVADRRYAGETEVSVPASVELVVFEFHGMSFRTRPGGIVYRYRLKGYDEDWRTTRERRVEYQGIPIGDYTFEVMAVDRDLVYSEQPATVELKVTRDARDEQIDELEQRVQERTREVEETHQQLEEAQAQLIAELEEELQTAHEMQMGLMPDKPPRIEGVEIAGVCIPTNHVGGDFFQYFARSGDRLAVCTADVTGHAMEAAIPVVMFSGILESQMEFDQPLGELFGKLNRSLCRTLNSRTFVCFSMGELDLRSRRLELANGGCPFPYHYRAAKQDVVELEIEAYPLGINAETEYPTLTVQLELGDRLVFCSDGIIEAENPDGDFFGFDRTAEIIARGCADGLTADSLLELIVEQVEVFSGNAPQGDDRTVVVMGMEK